MAARATHSTPMIHVAQVERSISFYALLGFSKVMTDRGNPLGWARLHSQSAEIMLLRAERPIDPRAQGFLFYLYTPDLVSLREHLLVNGVPVSSIKRPSYMSSGTINLADPDGYLLEVAQWGQPEQEAWERQLSAK